MTALFISDLHLTSQREDVTLAFERFLRELPQLGDTLYILGDLFEYWAGDDDVAAPFNQRVTGALAQTAARGVTLDFIHGNRDFIAGEGFADAAHLTLLPDPHPLQLEGVASVLLHGDTLCTDDHEYQAFRAKARTPAWRDAMLAQPLAARKAAIEQMRARSEAEKATKSAAIMDVNDTAVRQAFADSGAVRMIHGHTHRPGRHDYEVGGLARTRWVLPAWEQQPGYLRVSPEACALIDFD
ncbi:MAG TPA: UDP-2,3-diacylglucosamine diphosphatase [Burkholderiales bacterium]|nr:UDP-2,3-diacylglucosamine diphosphatase [Burkholderiales bacterium]